MSRLGFNYERPYQGNTNIWLTPPELVQAPGKFDFDPCAADPRPWDLAPINWTEKDDGLAKTWDPKLRGWVNPPYGPHTKRWLQKCAEHGNCIALVFARVETQAFFIAWRTADAFLFLPGRLSFYTPDGKLSTGKPAASVLIAWGKNNVEALQASGLAGALVVVSKVLEGRRVN
jgi:hypothetical protein